MDIPKLLLTVMLALFAISWPINISKTIRARTAKGKSLGFELLVWIGYLCGCIGKLIAYDFFKGGFDIGTHYDVIVYILDLALVTIDIVLTLRNMRLDRLAESKR